MALVEASAPGPWSPEAVVEFRDPHMGRGPRRCPDGSGPTQGAPSARAPGSILSLRGNAAEAGDATGRYGCHGVGRELRNEGLVDPRMVTIPRVE